MTTSKKLVYEALEFKNPERVPRDIWLLPWASERHPNEIQQMQKDFPSDFRSCPGYYKKTAPDIGNPYEIGESTDAWGCTFVNAQRGIIGEVKVPIVEKADENWDDLSKVHIPSEWLTIDKKKINAYCAKNSDYFTIAGVCPRPFERLQFIRGTENLYIDLMLRPQKMMDFIAEMHAFYCELLESWGRN